MRLILVVFLLSLSPVQAWGCFSSAKQSTHHDNLIKRTNTIVLAKAVSAKLVEENTGDFDEFTRGEHIKRNVYYEHKAIYEFELIQVIKGDLNKVFLINGVAGSVSHITHDNHSGRSFWMSSGGRVRLSKDCSLKPSFTIGYDYLIFLDEPYHFKSFEYIKEPNKDQWLSYVREKSNGSKL